MANSSDMILQFNTDKERYYLQTDQNGNPIPVTVNMNAKVIQGGDTSSLVGHVLTQGTPVDTAVVCIKITAPDSQTVVGRL